MRQGFHRQLCCEVLVIATECFSLSHAPLLSSYLMFCFSGLLGLAEDALGKPMDPLNNVFLELEWVWSFFMFLFLPLFLNCGILDRLLLGTALDCLHASLDVVANLGYFLTFRFCIFLPARFGSCQSSHLYQTYQ